MQFLRGISDLMVANQIAGLLNTYSGLGSQRYASNLLNGRTDYVVEIHGHHVIGAVGLEKQGHVLSEIKHLVVRPEWRRRRVGKFLISRVLHLATTPVVFSTIRDDNASSLNLFQSLGFSRAGRYMGNRGPVNLLIKELRACQSIAFWANIVEVSRLATGATFLRTSYGEGEETVELAADRYFILTIRFSHEELDGVPVQEEYRESPEEQNDAIETLDELLTNADTSEDEEDEEECNMVIGPRRIEIEILPKTATGGIFTKVKGVIINVFGPEGNFTDRGIAVREWQAQGPRLATISKYVSQEKYDIDRITVYGAGGRGGASTAVFYLKGNQEKAWDTLYTEFQKFTDSEITVIRNWAPSSPQTAPEGAGQNQGDYFTRTPYRYQPPVKTTAFRKAGDDIGATLFREQSETWDEQVRKGEANYGIPQYVLEEDGQKKEDPEDDIYGEATLCAAYGY
jgi:N-acetylglutamate synthase-like GNAT family acetyltransferase